MPKRAAVFGIFLTLGACGPGGAHQLSDDATRVTVLPCGLQLPAAPVSARQGAVVTVALGREIADSKVVVTRTPPGTEVTVQGEQLLVQPGYGTVGAQAVELTTTCGETVVRQALPLDVAPLRWGTTTTWAASAGPGGLEHPQLFVDSPDTAWLHGGFGFVPHQYTVTRDVWRLDLATLTWQRADAPTAPLLAGARLTPTGLGEWLLYGGQPDSQAVSADVLRVRAVGGSLEFTQQPRASGAEPSALGAFVYDAPRARALSVCGFTGVDVTCDVSAYDTASNTWSKLSPAGDAPTGRYGFFWAHDAAQQRVIVFSGAQYPTASDPVNAAQDVWALELAEQPVRWVKLLDQTSAATGRRNGCFAYDAAHERLFIWSGTADGRVAVPQLSVLTTTRGHERWTELHLPNAPTPRGSCAGLFDTAHNRVLFGFGNDLSGAMRDLVTLEL